MNPERLVNPFIIYWDMGRSASDRDIILRICDELVEAKVFVLDLRDLSAPICKGSINILRRLSSEHIKVNLTAGKTVLEKSADVIKDNGVAQLYVEFDSIASFQSSLDDIIRVINEGHAIGVSFYLNEKNYREIPAIISLCIENSIKELKFPIQRAGDEKIFYFDPEQANQISDELKKIDMEDLNNIIHDPFMWELFHDKKNPKEDGCDGAKTMMYISGNFDVTPCPILSVSLGNLCTATLKEIFSSEKRKQIRKILSRPPLECHNCKVVNGCKGGCRGRAYVKYGNFDKQDPACIIFLRRKISDNRVS